MWITLRAHVWTHEPPTVGVGDGRSTCAPGRVTMFVFFSPSVRPSLSLGFHRCCSARVWSWTHNLLVAFPTLLHRAEDDPGLEIFLYESWRENPWDFALPCSTALGILPDSISFKARSSRSYFRMRKKNTVSMICWIKKTKTFFLYFWWIKGD